jgi:hypothetical protein
MGRYIQCIFVFFCIWRVAMAERVAQRHRTEANGDDPVAVIVINDPPAPAVEVKQEPLSTKALNALIKEDTCSLCGHKAGRTNKRVHITTKHPEITSDNHPLVIAKLAAALPNIMKSMASAPKAVSVQVRVMEFFAAHSIPHQIVESPYWRAVLLAIRTQGDMELCKSRKTFATINDSLIVDRYYLRQKENHRHRRYSRTSAVSRATTTDLPVHSTQEEKVQGPVRSKQLGSRPSRVLFFRTSNFSNGQVAAHVRVNIQNTRHFSETHARLLNRCCSRKP